MVGQLQGRGAAGVRDRDDHVDVMLGTLALDLLGQLLAHAQARLVHRDAIDDRVGTRQVDVLENARLQLGAGRALLGVHLAFFGDVHGFAGCQVTDQGEAEDVQGNAFRGDHVFHAFVGVALAEDYRADAIGVAETDDAVAGDHRHHRVTADTAAVHVGNRSEHVFFGRLQLATHRQLMGEHVQQHFRVGVGVDVAQVGLVDLLGQLLDVGQVAVVRQGDAIGRVDVERLGLGRGRAARRRVAHVADTHVTDQALHVALLEHVTHQAIILAQE
ncbi:hypothetical protein D3C79_518680 [compost metagenome]